MTLNVKIKLLNPHAKLPTKAYSKGDSMVSGSAGWDVYAIGRHTISPGDRKIIRTGFATEFDPGWVAVVKDRGGMAGKFSMDTAAGVIDSDFRDEWGVVLCNHGNTQFVIEHGQKIAQVLFLPVPIVKWEEVDSLSDSLRGKGQLGSSDSVEPKKTVNVDFIVKE